MTLVQLTAGAENQNSQRRVVLDQRYRVYGSLTFHSVFLLINVFLYRWAFRRLLRESIDFRSFGFESLAGLVVICAAIVAIFYGYGKAIWILLRAAKRVLIWSDEILVERVFGYWRGPLRDIRLRKASFGWVGSLGRERYQLQLVGGGTVAEVLLLGEAGKAGFARLQELLPSVEETDKHASRLRGQVPRMLRQALASFAGRYRWVGKALFMAEMVGFYSALLAVAARFPNLNLVSLLALGLILIEVFVVLALFGALRAGRDVRRGVESAFKFLHVVLGVFVVSIAWEWFGRGNGPLWPMGVVAVLQASAILLEWLVPGAVFLAFARHGAHGSQALQTSPMEE